MNTNLPGYVLTPPQAKWFTIPHECILMYFNDFIWIVIIIWTDFIYTARSSDNKTHCYLLISQDRCYKVRWTDKHILRCPLNLHTETRITDPFIFYPQKKDYNFILLSSEKASPKTW